MIYVTSGTIASLLSSRLSPNDVSLGASTAIYGMTGVMTVYYLLVNNTKGKSIPASNIIDGLVVLELQSIAKSIVTNFVLLLIPMKLFGNIGYAAHLIGFFG